MELHRSGLADFVLARVQIEPFVLQDLPLAGDVLHFALEEGLQRGDQTLVTAPDVVPLALAQRLFGLTDPDQRRAVRGARPELVAGLDHVAAEILEVAQAGVFQPDFVHGDVVEHERLETSG